MRKRIILTLCLPFVFSASAWSDEFESDEEAYPSTEIADAYIDLRTGPGRGYPILQSVERGATIDVIKRRTDWFLVRTDRDNEGWVHRTQLVRTLNARGENVTLAEYGLEEFGKRTLEFGVMTGEFEGANGITVYGDYFITPQLSAEASFMQALGNVSENQLISAGLQHHFVPTWRVSPYVGIGVGNLSIKPSATLIESEDRRDVTRYAQGGISVHLLERFMFRLDYRHHLILTHRDYNEEIDEWKAGFAVFY